MIRGSRFFFIFIFLFILAISAAAHINVNAAGISMPTREVTLYVGDSYVLEGTKDAGTGDGDIEYYLYDDVKKKRVKYSDCLNLDGINGRVTALSPGSISVIVTLSVYDEASGKTDKYMDKCVVTVVKEENKTGLNYTYLNRAVGSKKIKLKVKNEKKGDVITWSSSDSKVAKVNKNGELSAKSDGTAMITATVKRKKKTLSYTCEVHVSTPVLDKNTITVRKGKTGKVNISGVVNGDEVQWVVSDSKVAAVSIDGTVLGKAEGSTNVNVKIEGVSLKLLICVEDRELGSPSEIIESAESLIGCAYSVEKRMEEGYYDCSSYVFRVYAPFGYLFGCKSQDDNAPTAADLGKWCDDNNCAVFKEPVSDLDKLIPGDLIFYSYGKSNGRFLNIDHVAIYGGDGTILHASDEETGVKRGKYWVDDNIVMVGRPIQ